ncbi:MAG: hypothetical protein FWE48_05945 [Coriobacteriia bacterium]|nr:hypothetical protein [Coriobacteriia bacterium]
MDFATSYPQQGGGEAYERTANDSSSFTAVASRGGRSALLLALVRVKQKCKAPTIADGALNRTVLTVL